MSLRWTRPDVPPEMLKDAKATDKPKSLGEACDSNTGAILTLYACPSCNKAGFAVDESEPVMIVD